MFIGHFGVGMAAKRVAPRVSLPVLFVAAQLADMLWPIFLAAGIETVRIAPRSGPVAAIIPGETAFTPLAFTSYPWSHSLVMLCVWGMMLAWVYRLNTGDKRGALVIGALVVSHWVLDWITHAPDMPLYPGSAKYGLALWNHPRGTIAVEVVLFAIGVAIYEGTTKGRNKAGQYSFWAMILLLLVAYTVSTSGAAPPSVTALWVTSIIAMVAGVALSAFVDRNRTLEDNSSDQNP